MNYSQTLEFLDSAMPSFQKKGAEAYKPGLERIVEFCRRIGNPQRNFFTIHVAGTDGKGSVSSMLAAVLQSAGYRTGLFTSPHIHEFRERIRVDGEIIPKQKVVNFVDKYHDAMVEVGLSYFEMTTAMAFDFFDQSDVEVAVIETGLGGRLDATNIVMPILSIITNISLEHADLLGDTLPKIAGEKAGIMKKSIPVMIGEHNAECDAVFESRAAELKSRVIYAEESFVMQESLPCENGGRYKLLRARDKHLFDLTVDLAGSYQAKNIVTVCAALDLLHEETPLTISRRALREGLATAAAVTGLRGRWQKIADAPLTVCDTGHTVNAFGQIARQLSELDRKGRIIAVLGFVNDKNIEGILSTLRSVPEPLTVILTRPSVERAMPLERVRECAEKSGLTCEYAETVSDACTRARELACEDDVIFIGGSTYVVGEVLSSPQ